MQSNEIVKELRSIKVLLYITIVCLLVVILQPQLTSLTISPIKDSSSNTKAEVNFKNIVQPQSTWSVDIVKDTFLKGKFDVVIDMCNNRIKEYPNDAYPYFYRSKAYRTLGKYKEALLDLDKAEAIAPMWRKKYTNPLRKDILKQELKKRFEGTPPKDKKEVEKKLKEIYQEYNVEKV